MCCVCSSILAFEAVVLGLRLDYNIRKRVSQQQTQNQHKMLLKYCHVMKPSCSDFYPALTKFCFSVKTSVICLMQNTQYG